MGPERFPAPSEVDDRTAGIGPRARDLTNYRLASRRIMRHVHMATMKSSLRRSLICDRQSPEVARDYAV